MERWSRERANQWWREQKWPVGANYITSSAVNDVEMWMDATFDPALIGKELVLLRQCGMNSARVFLSFPVWRREGRRFEANFDTFLRIAEAAGVCVLPVLFDDCAFDSGADPVYGPQKPPIPGVHNSRWVPSPGFAVQDNPGGLEACGDYVRAVVGGHRADRAILAWDLFNEPGNTGRGDKALPLLTRAFQWAREMDPIQPLTAGAWRFDGADRVTEACFALSDVISLHAYTPLPQTRALIEEAQEQGRPVLVTEWMHRPAGSTIEDHLPYFKREKIGAWQWGLLRNRTQTWLSWSTMRGEPDAHPALWQHDLLYEDGAPYRPEEVRLIQSLTADE